MSKIRNALSVIAAMTPNDQRTVAGALRETGHMIDRDMGDDWKARERAYLALAEIVENVSEQMPSLTRTNDRETSQDAAAKVELNISHTRRKVLEHAARYDDRGITDDELKRLFPTAPESTYRKRRSELTAFGYLEDSGMKRRNRAGNDEIVWRITDKGRKAL